MDETDLFKTAGLSTTGVAILLIVYKVIKSIMGKKLISSCCGKKFEVGVDVQTMTPKDEPITIDIKNPIINEKSGTGLNIKNEKSPKK